MTLQTRSLLVLALLALVAPSSAAPASSHRKSGRTADSTTASPSSWSKKTALAPLPDSDLVPFVTSRVERVPKPEEVPTAHRRPSKSRSTNYPSVDNSIDDDGEVPKAPKAAKGPKQSSRRRWGPDAYNLFADAETHSPSSYSVVRKVPTKYIRKVQLPYQRTPMAYDSTGSVTSSTISVAPIRYKIIDMGDPWVTWSHAQGYNPHEMQHQSGQQSQQQNFVRPNRQEGVISVGPGMYGGGGPEYGGGALYGGGPIYGGGGAGGGGFYRPPGGQAYGAGGQQAGAYSGLHGSVIDPFQRENYGGSRDVVPWSVQVGTSLTVNDDGRRSRRQFYVQSQRHQGELLG